jgi:hypothetical protein
MAKSKEDGLLESIANLNLIFEEKQENHQTYHERAKVYFALFKITSSEDYLHKASLDYNKAIALKKAELQDGSRDEQLSEYIVDSAKMKAFTGNIEGSIKSIKEARQYLPDGDNLTSLYVNNTINNIERLDEVKARLSNLRTQDGVNQELVGAVDILADVTSDLNLAVHDIEGKTNVHQEMLRNQANILGNHQGEISNITERLSNNDSDVGALRAEISGLKEALQSQASELASVIGALRTTQIMEKAALIDEFNNLDADSYAYAQSFASNLYSHLEIFNLAKMGLFDLSQEKLAPDWLGKVIAAVPAIGNTLDAINTYANKIYSQVDTITKEQKVKKINEILTHHFTVNDLKLYTQKVAIAMVKIPDINSEIQKDATPDELSRMGQMQQAFREFRDNTNQQIEILKQHAVGIDALDVEFSRISSLSLEHVSIFVEMLCRLDEVNGQSILPNNESLTTFICMNVLPQINQNISPQLNPEAEESKEELITHKKKCTIFSVSDIVYDNELLNHPEILSESLKQYSISEILDLSINIDSELIDRALETGDSELMLAGLMSVDYGNDLM